MLNQTRGLGGRVLDQLHEQTREHQPMLADLALRLEPFAAELLEAWAKSWRAIFDASGLAPESIALANPEEAMRSFLTELKQDHLFGAYDALIHWGAQAARAGLPYDNALQLLRESQRALLPWVLRAYGDDPRLALVLDALDDAYDGVVTAVGTAYIQALPTRLAATTRLHTLGQLTGGAGHALNNLLTAIIGRTQVLIEQTPDYALRDELQEIQSLAAMGGRMVQRVYDFSRGDAVRQPAHADVNAALRDAAEITRFVWRDQAEATGIVIDVVRDFADIPPAQAQPAALRQALVALVLNAIEAMPRGGLITLRTERAGERVFVAVIDNGEGMTAETRAQIFDPFFTTKGLPHLGLGLDTVLLVAEQANGTLQIESTLGQGTTVTLALPIAQDAGGGEMQAMLAARTAQILVIDNEPSVRDLLARLLKLHGHEIVTAESGVEGIAAFKARKFDLVLTDLGMPEMSGWDVAREIKKLNPRVPVALTTGWPVELNYKELKDRGVDKVVNKPFDMPQLLGMIDDALALLGKK